MPIEREFKYVLSPSDVLEAALGRQASKIMCIRQGYLPKAGRVRSICKMTRKGEAKGRPEHVFTFKHNLVNGDGVLEFEHTISADDFQRAWADCTHKLVKTRHEMTFDRHLFEVDLLKTAAHETYFALAECEVEPKADAPRRLPLLLDSHLLHAARLDDPRFTNRRLCDQAHARAILNDLLGETRAVA